MFRAWLRRAAIVLCASLLLGAIANAIAAAWLGAQSRAFLTPQKTQTYDWPAGTPKTWSWADSKETVERAGVKIETWERLADRSFLNYYNVGSVFLDRSAAKGRQFSGRDLDVMDLDTATVGANAEEVARQASEKAKVLKIISELEDRTAVRVTSGWPYPSFSGTLWLAHTYNAQTLKWTSRTIENRGTVTFGGAAVDRPWPTVFAWRPVPRGFLYNAATFGSPVPAAFAVGWLLRRRLRVEAGRCPACAYPVGWTDRCSECGRAGALWNVKRLARLARRAGPARPRPILAAVMVLLLVIAIPSALGATIEHKTTRGVIGIWGAALVIGRADRPWNYPGPAAYFAPPHVCILPRIATEGGATRLIIPCWPAVAVLGILAARRYWHRAICAASRDVVTESPCTISAPILEGPCAPSAA